ncbi:MAG TPA: nucleotidyltransferase domain-containing protein [Mucilaginibacter sp.]|jgi:hypothetical protein|nr:nucleotidyltransferase domain-containing protein [Mucilaginibacter sp.]
MEKEAFTRLTPYPAINELLFISAEAIAGILGNKVIGFYLTGSLTYNDFVPGRSDIDLLVVVREALSKEEIKKVEFFHFDLESRFPNWREKIECSYLPVMQLKNILPPEKPRPYFGGGKFYAEAPYGNEWIINQYFLYKYGIALTGPEFKTLCRPIDINDVQKACVADLFIEWQPKANDRKWLENSHYQSYLVLNICRILYVIFCAEAASKTVSARWVQCEFPEWSRLIGIALDWKYCMRMNEKEIAIEFLRFAIDKVKNDKGMHMPRSEV